MWSSDRHILVSSRLTLCVLPRRQTYPSIIHHTAQRRSTIPDSSYIVSLRLSPTSPDDICKGRPGKRKLPAADWKRNDSIPVVAVRIAMHDHRHVWVVWRRNEFLLAYGICRHKNAGHPQYKVMSVIYCAAAIENNNVTQDAIYTNGMTSWNSRLGKKCASGGLVYNVQTDTELRQNAHVNSFHYKEFKWYSCGSFVACRDRRRDKQTHDESDRSALCEGNYILCPASVFIGSVHPCGRHYHTEG